MFVCLCKGVSDRQIQQLVDAGARSLRDVREATGLGTQCGKCACEARQIVRDALGESLPTVQLFNPCQYEDGARAVA